MKSTERIRLFSTSRDFWDHGPPDLEPPQSPGRKMDGAIDNSRDARTIAAIVGDCGNGTIIYGITVLPGSASGSRHRQYLATLPITINVALGRIGVVPTRDEPKVWPLNDPLQIEAIHQLVADLSSARYAAANLRALS